MDVDHPWLKHGVVSERGTVCWELTIFCAMPYPYQITIKIIQRISNICFCMLEHGFSRNFFIISGLEIWVVLWPQSTKTSVGPPDSARWWSGAGLALADRQFVISERISQMTKGNVTAFVNLTKALKRLKVLECSRN